MPDNDQKAALAVADKAARSPRKNAKSGLYSWVNSKRLPGGRAFTKTRRELALLREELIRERGGKDKVTAGELVLIDSVVEGLGVQKLLGHYVRKYGVIDSQAAKRGSLELSPVLSRNWIAYSNVVRQGLLALDELRKNRAKDDDGLAAFHAYIGLTPSADGTYTEPAKESPQAGGDSPAQGQPEAVPAINSNGEVNDD